MQYFNQNTIDSRCKRQRIKQAKRTLYLSMSYILLSLALEGCNQSETVVNLEPKDSAILQETLHIGTDLDIAQLKVLSDYYKKEKNINVEWQRVTEANILTWLQIDDIQHISPNLNSESKLPKDLGMLLMHSVYTLNALGETHQLQPIASQTLSESIPKQYQDPNGEWYGLTYYARTLVYNKNKVNEPELINYASLANEKWLGRLCMTSVNNADNQTILKVMLPYRGQKKTPEVLSGWLNNMRNALDDDMSVLEQIQQNVCDVGIVNSDVFWQFAKANSNTNIRLTWANQINQGAVTNTITSGITKSSNEAGRALEFMEWLVTDKGQALLAFTTSTFPIINIKDKSINIQAVRPEWTKFKSDRTSLSDIVANKTRIERLTENTVDKSLINPIDE